MRPKILYLHGFASGRDSAKGMAVAERLAGRGVEVERLDLRLPSLERLSLRAMIEATRSAIGGPRDRALLVGSSLGGLTAARLAEEDPRVFGLFLLAPAFRFVERWRERLGDEGWSRWMEEGWLEVDDYATGGKARVHAGFPREVEAIDGGDFPDVRVPTVIVHGVNDDVVRVENSRRFAESRRHVRLVEVDDGHDLLATLPRTLELLERFVDPLVGVGAAQSSAMESGAPLGREGGAGARAARPRRGSR